MFLIPVLAAGAISAAQEPAPVSWVNPKLPDGPGLVHRVLKSDALGHEVGYVVWLPPEYAAQPSRRFPVVYFLHGMGGNEAADSAGFSGHLARAIGSGGFPPAVAAFPNGGRSGYRGGVETMILKELIPAIESAYRVLPGDDHRVVLGFSMGGAGSARLSLRHPEAFAAAASLGGGFRGEDAEIVSALDASLPRLAARKWGLFAVNGDQDRPEAFRPLEPLLREHGIAFQSQVLPNTGHDLGRYYELGLPAALKFLAQRLAPAP